MKDDRLLDDRDLADAFRSVRDAYDGTNAESNATLQRALFRTRTRERRQRLTRWVVLPIAAVLVASTAWAGVTGKLTPAVHAVLESFHAEHARPLTEAPVAAPASSAGASQAPPELPPAPIEAAVAPAPVEEANVAPVVVAPAVVSASSATPKIAPPSSRVAPAVDGSTASRGTTVVSAPPVDPPSSKEAATPSPPASAVDPHAALFAEAHRLHFTERDPARALAAWDRYLAAAPNGRFAPEARYNRALALVRLGRSEARTELEAFANGTYGGYRREEAKALLDALARDASRP